MKRLLFISPGNNLVFLGQALTAVRQEQGIPLDARNILAYQISDGLVSQEHVRQEASGADVVLFDIRAFPELVETLKGVRRDFPEKTFIPLMGGSMDVMSLCRMGPFSFDRFSSSSSPRSVNFRRIQQITALIDHLGGLLPVGGLRHARCWVHVVRYWTAGGKENITNLVRLVVREYCGGKGQKPAPPAELPQHFLCDPEGTRCYRTLKAWTAAVTGDGHLPLIAVLHYSGLHRESSLAGLSAIARAFEGRARVMPIAANGVDGLEPIRKYLLGRSSPKIDALASLLWFRLDGGPMGGSDEETRQILKQLDVPYFSAVTLYGREIETWRQSAEGASPVETFATVVLPELDGALLPVPVLGVVRQEHDGFQVTKAAAIDDRPAAFARRISAWTRLRHIQRRDKRVALILYDYPPGPAHAGNASYLDTARSLVAIMRHLGDNGYDTGGFEGNPLKELLDGNIHNDSGSDGWQGLSFSDGEYKAVWEGLPENARIGIIRKGEMIMNFRDLVIRTRSIRRFDESSGIAEETLRELIELACYIPSAANRQSLRYLPVIGSDMIDKVFPCLKWAGYLEDWPGPEPGERPPACLVVLCRKEDAADAICDSGIAAQTIMLGAAEKGLGGCIIASIDRDRLASGLGISDSWEVLLLIALGLPVETVVIDQIDAGGDIRYWRDRYGIHHVPKRKVDELMVRAEKLRENG